MFIFLLGVIVMLLSGALFSIPLTYGIAREFRKNRTTRDVPYEELFGKMQLIIICIFGPIFGLLMFLGTRQEGTEVRYAWPDRDDWERTTFSECKTILACNLPENVLKEADSVNQH